MWQWGEGVVNATAAAAAQRWRLPGCGAGPGWPLLPPPAYLTLGHGFQGREVLQRHHGSVRGWAGYLRWGGAEGWLLAGELNGKQAAPAAKLPLLRQPRSGSASCGPRRTASPAAKALLPL